MIKKGKGLWKFNNSLHKDTEYVKTMKQCINRVKEQYMIPVYNIEFIENNENNNIQLTNFRPIMFRSFIN